MSKHLKIAVNDYNQYFPWGKKKGIVVEVRDNFEFALKLLKKKVNQEGILKDLRKKAAFESKGQKRRRKSQEAVRRLKKAIRLEQEGPKKYKDTV